MSFKAADDYLKSSVKAPETAVLVFEDEDELDQAWVYLMGQSSQSRLMAFHMDEADVMSRLARTKPSPGHVVVQGTAPMVLDVYQ